MATIELAQLSSYLDDAQVDTITRAISNESAEDVDLDSNEDNQVLDGDVDDDLFVDFRDRLEANDLDADIYVPVDFEEVLTVSEFRVGSTYALQGVLESLKEDFFVEDVGDTELIVDDEEEEIDDDNDETEEEESYLDDDEGVIEMKDEQLRRIWRLMNQAVHESISSNLAIFVRD